MDSAVIGDSFYRAVLLHFGIVCCVCATDDGPIYSLTFKPYLAAFLTIVEAFTFKAPAICLVVR